MFDIPESDIIGVRVDEETIKTKSSPEYIHSRQATATGDLDESSQQANAIKAEQTNDSKVSIPTC